MGLRSPVIIRALLIAFVICLAWYTVQLYANLFGVFTPSAPVEEAVEQMDKEPNIKIDDKPVKDPDMLIDEEKIKAAEKEWEKAEKDVIVPEKFTKFNCRMKKSCASSEFNFRIMSGSANVVGPSICFNGKWVMKNSLNNVDRGMNIAVVDGKTGETVNKGVFDLYGKDSTDLKAFLRKVKEHEVLLITSYDDAAFRLDDEARKILAEHGSEKAKTIAFRDNWIFVGSKKMKHPTGLEQIMVNDKAKNKFGDWPEAITAEGCVPKL